MRDERQKEAHLYQSTYFIEKSTNTFADNLAAFGLAFILAGIVDGRSQVLMCNVGPTYSITCEPGIWEEWIATCNFCAGAPFLVTVDRRTQQKMVKGTPFLKRGKNAGWLLSRWAAQTENFQLTNW